MKKVLIMAAAVALSAGSLIAAQCAALTQEGAQCKRNAAEGSKFCWQHARMKGVEQADHSVTADARCQAKTLEGEQCKRKAVDGSKFCAQHAKGAAAGAVKAKAKSVKAKAKKDADEAVEAAADEATVKPVKAKKPVKAAKAKAKAKTAKVKKVAEEAK